MKKSCEKIIFFFFGQASCVHHWTGWHKIYIFKVGIYLPFPCSGPSTGDTLDWIALYTDHTLWWITEILYTARTEIQLVTASLINLWVQPRDVFLDKYVELRSQYPSSFETDGAHQVIKMRDERKVQHLRGVPTHPKKQFTRTCISGTICIQSSLLELDHFLIFFTFGLERLSLFLRVSTVMCGTLGSNPNCVPPWLFHYPCRVPLMTLQQIHWSSSLQRNSCPGSLTRGHGIVQGHREKELRQERSQGSDPFVMLWASRCRQWH